MFSAPCNWPVLGCDTCGVWSGMDTEMQEEVSAWAVQYLWEWTNRRFGPCEVSYRPCRKTCDGYAIGGPYLLNGRFYNMVCGLCSGDSCSCKHVSQILLPGPISSVTSVLIGDEELPLTSVRVDDWSVIVRTDGEHFPDCQDMGADVGEPDTWQVSIMQGEAVPPGGGIVAGVLACEFAKSFYDPGACRLPQRVTSISRQGLTMAILDNFDGLNQGYTGIWAIDSWISAANHPQRRSTITSPDVNVPRQTTWMYESS